MSGGSGNVILNDLWANNIYSGARRQLYPVAPWPAARYFHATVIINNTLYLFGGTSLQLAYNDCWSLDLQTWTWAQINTTNTPSPRLGHTLVPLNSTAIMTFSGMLSDNTASNETWIWNLHDNSWTQVASITSPAGRGFYSLSMFASGKIVLFGGTSATYEMFADTWAFDIASMQWSQLTLSQASHVPQPRTQQGTTMFGCNKMLVMGGLVMSRIAQSASATTMTGSFANDTVFEWQLLQSAGLTARFMFVAGTYAQSDDLCIQSQMTINITSQAVYEIFVLFGVNSLGEQIVQGMLQSTNPGCNPGYVAATPTDVCSPCPQGTYAAQTGSTTCMACAVGSTTDGTNASSAQQCSLCDDGFCHSGSCVISAANQSPSCQCSMIYSSTSQCKALSTTGITIIALSVGVVVLAALAFSVKMMLRRFRNANNSLLGQLADQEKVFESSWKIDASEIKLERMIGRGGYGEVWCGTWGDRPVAVKKLLRYSNGDGDEQLMSFVEVHDSLLRSESGSQAESEFVDEIKLIRRIKHINIVLCFGAGTLSDGSMFLVLEFCSRGSLHSILEDASVEWPWLRQIDIALHAARGIHYLHTMEPISIHRDIKSPNVLVSEGWIAKVQLSLPYFTSV